VPIRARYRALLDHPLEREIELRVIGFPKKLAAHEGWK
jgi:hypothetical protein